MTMIQELTKLTAAEYLVLERAADHKSEYSTGEIRPMPGASRKHNLIATNILASLHFQLRKQPCEVYPSDMRVKVEATELITYPDISVVCGEPRFDDSHKDTLLNPTVLIEVLSPSTAAYDRGDKSENYRQIASLQAYVLVAQDKLHVEYYSRQPDNSWRFTEFKRAGDHVTLAVINCELALEDIYEKVTLDQPRVLNGQSHQE
ncbi:MAG: Uma2 family endonuclease [Caldilineaceae bacterium]